MKTSLIKFALFLSSSVIGGALGGYYAASFSPVPAQIGIIDIQSMVLSAASGKNQTEENAKALTKKIKVVTDKLTEQGIVVLDAQYVINAPEEAYVSID
jgi:hypothetical protein